MTKEEIEIEVKKMVIYNDGYFLMGTLAYHQMGDLSRSEDDLFCASGQSEDYYIGSWTTGFGFFNVCFPKESSRELTKKEIEEYNKIYVQIGSQPPIKLKVNNDGKGH